MLESGLAFILFKAALGFGLPLAFAVHQLWGLRRDERLARARTVVSLSEGSAELPHAEREAVRRAA